MPTSLVADTSSFVTLSDSGTTPSISGYTGTLLVSVTASDGNIKVTTTTKFKTGLVIVAMVQIVMMNQLIALEIV